MGFVPRFVLAGLIAAVLPGLAHAAEADARWGLYGRLAAGGAWVHSLSTGGRAVARYTWVRPGEELRAEHRLEGTPLVTVETITPGAEAGTLAISTQENDQAGPSRSVVTLNPDGSAVELFVASNGVHGRATYSLDGAGAYHAHTEAEVDGVWREVYSSEGARLRD